MFIFTPRGLQNAHWGEDEGTEAVRASGPHGADRAGDRVGGRLRPEDFAHHGDVWPFSRQTPGASNPTKEKLKVTSQERGHTGTQARTCWVPGGSGWWCNSRSGNRRSEEKDSEGQVLIWVHKGESWRLLQRFETPRSWKDGSGRSMKGGRPGGLSAPTLSAGSSSCKTA